LRSPCKGCLKYPLSFVWSTPVTSPQGRPMNTDNTRRPNHHFLSLSPVFDIRRRPLRSCSPESRSCGLRFFGAFRFPCSRPSSFSFTFPALKSFPSLAASLQKPLAFEGDGLPLPSPLLSFSQAPIFRRSPFSFFFPSYDWLRT